MYLFVPEQQYNFNTNQIKIQQMNFLKYSYLAAYVLINTFHGIIFAAFGPIILYFAKVTHQDETYFSFVFFAKTIGFLIGAILAKILPKYLSYHRIFATAIIICGLSLIASSIDFGFWNLAINVVIIGITCCIFEVLGIYCTFKVFFQDNQDYWLQIEIIFFGVGGLIGPYLVLFTEELGFRAIGILIFMCITPIIMLETPQNNKAEELIQQKKKLLQLPLSVEISLCILILIYIGLLGAYPSWMPTYAVKSGAFNESQANILTSIFWVVNIIGKIAQLFMEGQIQVRIFRLLKYTLVCGAISIILQWLGYFSILCYFIIITVAYFLSSLFALFYTVALEHGYQLSTSATANISLCSILAEGVLVTPIGYLMKFFGFKAFIYSAFVINLLIFAIFAKTNQFMEKDSKQKKSKRQIIN